MTDLQALIARPDWFEQAECRGMDVQWFYPGHDARRSDVGAILAVCASCPVRDECAQYARDNHELYGIWGGMQSDIRRGRGRGRRLSQVTS